MLNEVVDQLAIEPRSGANGAQIIGQATAGQEAGPDLMTCADDGRASVMKKAAADRGDSYPAVFQAHAAVYPMARTCDS